MFIRTLDELEKLGRIRRPLGNDAFRSARFLTAADRMGYSYNENRVNQGTDAVIWLKHHWEANYIISGRGEVTDLTSGAHWVLEAGTLYTVGPNDRHRLQITEDAHYISIFCPPLRGDETFDKDGGYSSSGPIAPTDRRMFVKRADAMRRSGQEMVVADGRVRTLRMLNKADDIGFGFSDVHLAAGAEAVLWYKHHWEANHILSGTGTVTDLASGETWKLEPSMAYCVGPKDRHRLRADSDMHVVSIFCPPLVGDEQHDADGALTPSGAVPLGPPDT
jgi:quercetin dioxygenase-like cupin family protein